ncbi:MAG: threonylcarbamoyl-AMP synthase [Gammaproteobacteria bacterium]|nr:MAG: threonylcarbamoyl-AMP synthase [Gammaproteobacteria bacterium]
MANITAHAPWQLRRAAEIVHHGGVIAYPTEAVYGLGCNPNDSLAVSHLLAIKQRSIDKGLILIAAEFMQLEPYIGKISKSIYQKIEKSWPGPVTWLLPKAEHTPAWLCGKHDKIAVRVTAHPIAAALCRACDSALVSTSANRDGQAPARNSLAVRRKLRGIDKIVHGTTGGLAQPSAIIDALSGQVIRATKT